MIKTAFVFLLGLLFWQGAEAQKHSKSQQKKADTLLYYMKNSGEFVANKDSADYFLFIMPPDNSSGKLLYPITGYYPNGNRKMVTASTTNDFQRLKFEGPCITFYPSGKRNTIAVFKNGLMDGEMTEYYPNGKLYCIEKRDSNNNSLLIECRDSSGKVLAENGKGHWLKYDWHLKNVTIEGNITDSLEEGEWHGPIGDTGKFVCTYIMGKLISGIGYDKSGKEYSFTKFETPPEFKGGKKAFDKFLWKKIDYPKDASMYEFQDKVLVSFMVEKNGTLTDISILDENKYSKGPKIFRDTYYSLCTAALLGVKSSPPWIPGKRYGMLAKMQCIVPIVFGINH